VKSDPFEREVQSCAVAVLPWKDIASFKVMPVEMMFMMQDERNPRSSSGNEKAKIGELKGSRPSQDEIGELLTTPHTRPKNQNKAFEPCSISVVSSRADGIGAPTRCRPRDTRDLSHDACLDIF
jgi:hypothetical protein